MQILPSKYCVIKMNSILLGFIVTLYVIKDLAALLGMFKYSKLISSQSKLTSNLPLISAGHIIDAYSSVD